MRSFLSNNCFPQWSSRSSVTFVLNKQAFNSAKIAEIICSKDISLEKHIWHFSVEIYVWIIFTFSLGVCNRQPCTANSLITMSCIHIVLHPRTLQNCRLSFSKPFINILNVFIFHMKFICFCSHLICFSASFRPAQGIPSKCRCKFFT